MWILWLCLQICIDWVNGATQWGLLRNLLPPLRTPPAPLLRSTKPWVSAYLCRSLQGYYPPIADCKEFGRYWKSSDKQQCLKTLRLSIISKYKFISPWSTPRGKDELSTDQCMLHPSLQVNQGQNGGKLCEVDVYKQGLSSHTCHTLPLCRRLHLRQGKQEVAVKRAGTRICIAWLASLTGCLSSKLCLPSKPSDLIIALIPSLITWSCPICKGSTTPSSFPL